MILARARTGTINDFLSPPLILVTPFISFIKHNDYSYTAPELWICAAGLVAFGLLCGAVMALGGTWLRVLGTAGLLTLFVDFQSEWFDEQPALRVLAFAVGMLLLCWVVRDNLHRITLPVFATMLAAAAVFPGSSGEASFDRPDRDADARGASDPPSSVVVHLIFDEFIGIEGIPSEASNGTEARGMLRSFLQDNGFYVFGRAYSRFAYTRNAIPNILNSTSVPENAYFVVGPRPYRLRQNKYFSAMNKNGYIINVYQTDFMDFCTGYETLVASCHTYMSTGIEHLQYMQMSPVTKAWLALDTFSRLTVIERALGYLYNRLRQQVQSHGFDLPPWVLSRFHLAAARAGHILDIIANDVARARAGEMFFAHVLIPHHPYTYGRSCNVRDPVNWGFANDRAPLPPNSAESRTGRYTLYLEQALCVRAKLEMMFNRWRRAGLFDRMKIIIHGDHGSRIFLHEPNWPNRDLLLTSDYIDSFSTLFTLKAPSLKPAYDRRMVAVQDLLMPIARGQPLDRLPVRGAEPYVLLENDASMVRQPMPEFGDPEREGNRIHLSRP